jgi:hypothetical protein
MAHSEHRQRRLQIPRLPSLGRHGVGCSWHEEVQAVDSIPMRDPDLQDIEIVIDATLGPQCRAQ